MKTITMASPFFNDEDRRLIYSEIDIILNSSLSMGRNVKKFEQDFSSLIGIKNSIAMNSCTSCLEAALLACNISGFEVIIPSETFIATGMAVHLTGGIPVFAEISKKTLCLDYESVISKVTKRTRAIILVHMAGYITPDIFKIKKYCDENGIFLIEDAAHAIGAEINGIKSGAIGHIGCFSFYPTKIITSGEGGMLVTDDAAIAEYARSFQNRGVDTTSLTELYVNSGRNVRMTEMSALLGWVQLRNLDAYLIRRRTVASHYINHLGTIDGLYIVAPEELTQSSFWKFPIILDSRHNRDLVVKKMLSMGVMVDCSYNPPVHLQPIFIKEYGTGKGLLPVTESLLSGVVCLPCHQEMTEIDANIVTNSLIAAIS